MLWSPVIPNSSLEFPFKPLGAVDYLHICKEFDTIILRDIPRMNLDRKTEARRFITLIDTLYDNKVSLWLVSIPLIKFEQMAILLSGI